MSAESDRILQELQRLHGETDALRKTGPWTGLAFIACTIAAGVFAPALAPVIAVVTTGFAAAMLYLKIADERKIAAREATLRQSGTVLARPPGLQSS